MRMRDTFIISLAIIVLSVAFISTTQTIQKNQNNILSRVESLEQSAEDPGEDPGETPVAKNYVKVVKLQPGETLQLTEDMYFIDVEFNRDQNGGIYSDPVDGPHSERVDVFETDYDYDDDNSYKFRYYIGSHYYFYSLTAIMNSEFQTKPGIKYISGYGLPFITLSENNTNPATVIIYYL